MSNAASNVDPRHQERRFVAQTLHRPSQSLHSNQIVHQQRPLPSNHPFPAQSQPPPNSMIGPTAPAAPYDPNVYPSYPPPERHQQDYEHFIMTQLSVPATNQPSLSAPAGNTMGRPPQAVYRDNTIERMVQKDQYANPYAATSSTNPQATLGGGYTMHNQNLYPTTSNSSYANATTAYPGAQAASGIYNYSDPSLLSPDSIHSIESPPVMMHQGPGRSQTIPLYSSVNRPNVSPEKEVPFSQIVARNSSSPQSSWAASSSPTNPNYNQTGYFPVTGSTTTNGNGVMMAQQIQTGAPQMQQNALTQPQGLQPHLSKGALQQSDRRAATVPSGSQFVVNASHVPPENISGRKMAAAVSRRDPQQRLTNPQTTSSQRSLQPGSSVYAGKRAGSNASAISQAGNSHKRGRRDIDTDSSSSEGPAQPAQPARLPGACGPCKKLKMKCLFKEGEDACQRCRNSGRGHLCIVGPRKPRQPSNKKDMLLQKLKEKDAVIESLLKQLHNPHLVTPLQLDPARISPSLSSSKDDHQLDPHIVEWIEKAQASIKHNGGTSIGGYRVFDVESSSDDSDGNDLTSPKYGFKHTSRISSESAEQQSSDRSGYSGQLGPNGVQGEGGTLSRRASSTKLHSLPMDSTPIGMLADLSLKETEGKRSRAASAIDAGEIPQPDPEEENELGVARKDYFQPGPAAHLGLRKIIIERRNVPEIMTTGLITPAEVDKLFDIFFKKMNLFVSILDEAIHTPATTFGRCPFLFTVVCAISSRYYMERPELYSIAMHFAKSAAANALIDGWKSVEVCQAYILMSVYSLPSRKWEEAREWLYLGLAIRMATDLNLHLPSTTKVVNEQHERELLNRTRTWLICHNLDRSTSAQLGKPFTIQDDWIIRNSKEWWHRSKFNHPYDLHLVAYTDMLRNIMANFQKMVYSDPNSGNGLNKNLNFKDVAFNFDDQLQAWKSECAVRFATHSDPTNSQCAYRVQLLPFYVHYSRLVILSFAFHSGILKEKTPSQDVVMRCLDAASSVIKVIVEVHAKTEYLRYAPDGHFVFVSFASAFLIKMLRKEPVPFLDEEQRQRVIELIERLIETLRSKQVAVDERHAPMLYSRFLSNLLAKHKGGKEEQQPQSNGRNATPSTASSTSQQPPTPLEKVSAHMHHQLSPSIEIVPPQPDRGDANMQGFDNDFGAFDPTPNPLSQHQHQQSQAPHVQPATFGMLNTFASASFDSSNLSAATSTIHPGSTVHGSQYGDAMPITADDFMLAPMYAVDNPGFWEHGMMPAFSWGPVGIPWEMQIDAQPYETTHMGGLQQ